MNRAIFLDRDGVINPMVYNAEYGLVDSPANPDEFELLPNAAALVSAINRLGLLAVVVSNQPGIAKGKYTRAILDATTDKMRRELAAAGAHLDGVYYCLHHPEAVVEEFRVRCNCRKPKPGLLQQAARELSIDLAQSYMIGDGITDVLAGQAAGARTIFVNSKRCYVCEELTRLKATPDYLVANPAEAVKVIQHAEAGNRAALSSFIPPCFAAHAVMAAPLDSVTA